MPFYEYQCQNCGHELEALQKMSDTPLVTCPACQRDTLKKKISAAGFRLKGSSWYETDFKSSNKKQLASGDSTTNSGSNNSDQPGSPADSSANQAQSKDANTTASTNESASSKSSDSSSTQSTNSTQSAPKKD